VRAQKVAQGVTPEQLDTFILSSQRDLDSFAQSIQAKKDGAAKLEQERLRQQVGAITVTLACVLSITTCLVIPLLLSLTRRCNHALSLVCVSIINYHYLPFATRHSRFIIPSFL
jgi:hypothetical protein